MTKVTEKSTKAQIYEAYNEALKEIESMKAMMNDSPAEKAKAEALEASLHNAETAAENTANVFNESIIKQYNDLKIAIDTYEKRLKDMYGVEVKAEAMAAMINAHKVKKAELDSEFTQKKADLDTQLIVKKSEVGAEMVSLANALQKAKDQMDEAEREYKNNLDKIRKREAEEYEYDLKIARKKDANEWEEEKTRREVVIELKENDVIVREEALAKREDQIAEMEAKINAIPDMIKDAEDKAAKKAKEKADAAHLFEKRALEKESEHNKTLADEKIKTLENQVKALTVERDNALSKLDAAYAEMKALAATTVQAGATVKVVTSENK